MLGEDSGAEDGFVVSDHYLSDDEGIHNAQMNLNDMCAELQGVPIIVCTWWHMRHRQQWQSQCRFRSSS